MSQDITNLIASNPQGVTFTTLFIGLLVYVMRTNETREKAYRDTIEKLSTALNTFDDLREKVENYFTKKGE